MDGPLSDIKENYKVMAACKFLISLITFSFKSLFLC